MAIDTPPRPIVLYRHADEIRELVAAFEARTLAKERWSHQAHLTVGVAFLRRMARDAALDALRDGILRYNESVGTPNSDTRGYHETTTRFYVWSIEAYLGTRPPYLDILTAVNGLLVSPYGSKDFPFEFYSRERLLSVAARRGWVEPDLKPLAADSV